MLDDASAQVTIRTTRGPLDAADAAAVRALADRAAAADGVAPLSEQPLLWLSEPEAPVVHLSAIRDDALVGYAQLDVGSQAATRAELVVDPGHRRLGVGRALLAGAFTETATVPGRALRVWAHGDLPAARRFAQDRGMPVVRELLQMRLDLAARPTTAPTLPAGVQVRQFEPGRDEDAWRRVNSRAFAHHPEQGRMTSADLRARESEPWFDPAGFLLAERDGILLGSVWTKVHPAGEHGPEPVGEIYVVGVDPDAQGLGLGRALTALGLDHLAARGLSAAILYTDADNTVAVHTYESAGFVRSAVDVMFGSNTPSSAAGVTMGA
ncbi:mycothiol synthase [Cellulomonas fengjieae]|uniref:Mycothiol acetyltransferase n=1 Tax=Cellulomonas fengjieae TaxID=2819978 RepID=A0ABS3SCN4_9CELL|nr:mycothiol synthase [Cellulomonas fengjieae]MBO3083402.1 mycothiol synthase [Cellulomonas fengjieae]QVI65260.1 mycothiol synthase [Cellulomonas fengjieae]